MGTGTQSSTAVCVPSAAAISTGTKRIDRRLAQALQRKIDAIKKSIRPQTDLIIAIVWSLAYIMILLFSGALLFAYAFRPAIQIN